MRYFRIEEFVCKCGCGQARMSEIFLNAVDQLRQRYGKPLAVSSGYRCPGHNSRVSSSGATGPHTTGMAADFLVDRGDALKLLRIALDMGFSGIGVKQHGSGRFLHLDILSDAPGQPRPTLWSYP